MSQQSWELMGDGTLFAAVVANDVKFCREKVHAAFQHAAKFNGTVEIWDLTRLRKRKCKMGFR